MTASVPAMRHSWTAGRSLRENDQEVKRQVEEEARSRELESLRNQCDKLRNENEDLKKRTSAGSRLKEIFIGAPDWLRTGMERQTSQSSNEEEDFEEQEREPVEAESVRISGTFGGFAKTARERLDVVMPVEGDVPIICVLPLLKELFKEAERRVQEKKEEIEVFEEECKKEGHAHEAKKRERLENDLKHAEGIVPIWQGIAAILRPESAEDGTDDSALVKETEKLKQTIKQLRRDLKTSRDDAAVAGKTTVNALKQVKALENQVKALEAQAEEMKAKLSSDVSPAKSEPRNGLDVSDAKELRKELAASREDLARAESQLEQQRLKNETLSKFLASAEHVSIKLKEQLGEAGGFPVPVLPPLSAQGTASPTPPYKPQSWFYGGAGGEPRSGNSSAAATPPRQRGIENTHRPAGNPYSRLRAMGTSGSPYRSGRVTPKDDILKDQVKELERWAEQLKALSKK